MLLSKMKETIFQICNRTIWTRNQAFKSGLTPDPTCLRCDAPETMEYLLYIWEHYSAKIWAQLGRALTLLLSQHMGEYTPAIILTLLEIVLNKPLLLSCYTVRTATSRLWLSSYCNKSNVTWSSDMQATVSKTTRRIAAVHTSPTNLYSKKKYSINRASKSPTFSGHALLP
jgi:hypothetical protein